MNGRADAAEPSFEGLRVLWVAQTFHPTVGGAETYVHELAMEMARKGADVVVMAPDRRDDPPTGETPEGAAPYGYRLLRCDFHQGWMLKVLYHLRFIPFAFELRRVLADVRPDIVHFQYASPFAILYHQARLAGARGVFATAHGQDILFMQNDLLGHFIFHRVAEGLDAVFMASDESERMVMDGTTRMANLRTVYCGTRPDLFVPVPRAPGPRVVLSVCRLVRRKRVDLIIDAFDAIADRHRDAVLHIVGGGEERPRLESRARSAAASDRIHFLGKLPAEDLVREFQSCYVHVMAPMSVPERNEMEGFGIASIEAMSCGRPVIGSTDGGIRSAIREGPDGWGLIFEQGNAEALAESMDRMLSRPDEAEDMGRRGRRAVLERFNWDVISDLMLEEYWRALTR